MYPEPQQLLVASDDMRERCGGAGGGVGYDR